MLYTCSFFIMKGEERMKKIKQHDERDCGAACFATIMSYYGSCITLQEARKRVHTDINGTTIYNIVSAAHDIKMKADAYEGAYSDLLDSIKDGTIKLPCIVHVITEDNLEHFLVLLKASGRKVKVFDPGRGKISYSVENFCHFWTGHVIDIRPDNAYVPLKTSVDRKVYHSILKAMVPKYIIAVCMSLAVVVISVLGTLGYQIVVDGFMSQRSQQVSENIVDVEESEEIHSEGDLHAEEEADFGAFNKTFNKLDKDVPLEKLYDNFRMVIIVLAGLYILQFFIQLLRDVIIASMSKKADKSVMRLYTDKILKLPLDFFQNITSGELISRFSDLSAVRSLFTEYSLAIIFDVIVFVCGSIMMCIINSTLFLIILGVAVLYAILIYGFSHSISKVNTRYMSKNAKTVSDFKELTDGIETIRLSCGEDVIKNRLLNDYDNITQIGFHGNVLFSLQNSFAIVLESASAILALYVGSLLVREGVLSMGYLITFSMLISYMLSPINNLVEAQPSVQKAIVAMRRLNDVVFVNDEDEAVGNGGLMMGDIEFDNVSFSYVEDCPVISDANIKIRKGEKVLLNGTNGCGKSTLVRLILAIYAPDNGEIRINNRNIQSIPKHYLRKKISYIPQDVFILSDTIYENIAMGNPEVSDEDIVTALNLVGLDEYVKQLPAGLDAYLYENGRNLSGGQKQKIAIARALVRDPEILILDETLSQIEAETRARIVNAIFRKYPKMTCVLISHDREVHSLCDRVIEL